MLYVVGGDGTLRLDGRDVQVAAGSFAVVPRGTDYGFTRRGRNRRSSSWRRCRARPARSDWNCG